MTEDDRSEGNTSEGLDNAVATLASRIEGIVKQLGELQDLAREQGIFVADRELVSCPRCDLVEDVLVDGRLITSRAESLGRDTGLRFIEDTEAVDRLTCPECGCEAVPDEV